MSGGKKSQYPVRYIGITLEVQSIFGTCAQNLEYHHDIEKRHK